MDIKSPLLLKIKGALFLVLGLLAAGLLLWLTAPAFTWQVPVLLGLTIWAFCRTYYFCFYVMEKYADPNFRYAGLWDLFLYLSGLKKKPELRKD